MKYLSLLLVSLLYATQAPTMAAEDDKKKSKRELKEEAKKKEDDAKKKADKEKNKTTFNAIVATTGASTDTDATELKSLMNTGTVFVCPDVKVEDGKLNATLTINKLEARLSKSDVNKVIKSNAKFKLEKIDEQKEEKVKPEKKSDKKDAKKDEKMDEKKDTAEPKKDQ